MLLMKIKLDTLITVLLLEVIQILFKISQASL